MRNLATISLLTITLVCIALRNKIESRCSAHQQSSSESPQKSQQVDDLLKRWKDDAYRGYLDGAVWSLTHGYSDYERMEEVLKTFQSYLEALSKYEKGSHSLEQVGVIKALQDKTAGSLDDEDQAIRAFAAIVLGVSGDRTYAPQIAKLLSERKSNNQHERVDRGRAAVSLGLLGAKEYADELAVLLESSNHYDRAGAASGLGLMRAKEKAGAVFKLLNDPDLSEDVQSNAIYSLVAMEAKEYLPEIARKLDSPEYEAQVAAIDAIVAFGAKEYIKDIAKKLNGHSFFETKERALSALLRFGGKEYEGEIAKVLDDNVAGDNAAIVLAIMGANEYKRRIARMLNDAAASSGAMIALGIMKASEYAPLISKRLNDKEDVVRDYAAVALVLMEARLYATRAVSRIEQSKYGLDILKNFGLYNEDYLHLRNRANESLKKLKVKHQ